MPDHDLTAARALAALEVIAERVRSDEDFAREVAAALADGGEDGTPVAKSPQEPVPAEAGPAAESAAGPAAGPVAITEPEPDPATAEPGAAPSPPRHSAWPVAIAGVLAFAAAGTGITIAATTHFAPGPGHYTYADSPDTNPLSDFTVFDWSADNHGAVTGTFRAIDPADDTNDFSQDFTGRQEGDTLTLIIVTGTSHTTLHGTLTKSTLTFRAASATSPLTRLILRKTTLAAFDKAVSDYKVRHPIAPPGTSA